MERDRIKLPDLVIHADWSVRPGKRWMARATRQENGRYLVEAPQPAGGPATLLYRLRSWAGPKGVVLAGFDFPIGLPYSYARKVGVDDFVSLLPKLGWGKWETFFRVAERRDQIGLDRPFYPQRPGGTKQKHLLDALDVESMDHLRRACELAGPGQSAAAPLFWTLGPNQVGKAAISGWRDMLAPALRDPALDVALWPFAGSLSTLLRPGRIVVAETYPADYYSYLGMTVPVSKRTHVGRKAALQKTKQWMASRKLDATPALAMAIASRFGEDADGEDRFDAAVGLLAMLDIIQRGEPAKAPSNDRIRRIEGWILGRVQYQAPGETEHPPGA